MTQQSQTIKQNKESKPLSSLLASYKTQSENAACLFYRV